MHAFCLTSITGCSKCHHEFPRTTDNLVDYSGYNYEEWRPRSGAEHKAKGIATLKANTKTELQALESEEGVRYSELFRLSYYDPVKMHVVDPMHNLLLGEASVIGINLEKNL